MMRILSRLVLPALLMLCARQGFAVDGQVLINQSTVMAAGGFPYRITQPGSYKLSGNLSAPVNVSAIKFDTSNATLDLNGFTIGCNFADGAAFAQGCITDGSVAQTSLEIRNGSIFVSATAATYSTGNYVAGIYLSMSSSSTVEGVHLGGTAKNFSVGGTVTGKNFVLRNNTYAGPAGPSVTCPSVVIGNVNGTLGAGQSGTGCVGNSNINFIGF